MYIGQWPGAFPDNPTWVPGQFFFDSVHQSLNSSDFDFNFIVVQSSQGRCIKYSFTPPNTEYWVATDFSATNQNQILLYNIYFPGWSACLRMDAQTGNTYYQVYFPQGGLTIYSFIIRTSVKVVWLLACSLRLLHHRISQRYPMVDVEAILNFIS